MTNRLADHLEAFGLLRLGGEVCDGISFVHDLAYDDFQDVFESDNPGNATVVVQNDGDVFSLGLEHDQQLVGGCTFVDHQDGVNEVLQGCLQVFTLDYHFEYSTFDHEPLNVVETFSDHDEPRVFRVEQFIFGFFQRLVPSNEADGHARSHDVGGLAVVQVEDTFDHLGFFRVDRFLFLADSGQGPDFCFVGRRAVVFSQEQAVERLQEPHQWSERHGQKDNGSGHHRSDEHGMTVSEILRKDFGELNDHDRQDVGEPQQELLVRLQDIGCDLGNPERPDDIGDVVPDDDCDDGFREVRFDLLDQFAVGALLGEQSSSAQGQGKESRFGAAKESGGR